MTKIMTVANPKGGVGKSTTVINLAASLAIAQKNVLVIDMDPQGSTSAGLGFHNGKIKSSLFEVLNSEALITDGIHQAILDNLQIVPMKLDGLDQEKVLLDVTKNIYRLKASLINLILNDQYQYDYIIIDTPPTINNLTLGALVASHSVLVPLQCSYFSLDSTRKLFETITMIKNTSNTSLEIEGILVTFYEKGTRLSQKVLEEMPTDYRKHIFNTIIKKNTAIGYAVFKHRPVALVDCYSSGAQGYFSLASEILRRNQQAIREPTELFYI